METSATGLGEFLRTRRAQFRPEDVGLTQFGHRRRVPGLRREEVAQLAGVSVAYYTRLEQGLSQNASDAVLDAIARVLRLDDDERTHLYNHARPRPHTRRHARPEHLRPSIRQLIESFDRVPALVIGRRADVLAWNPMAHALLAGHLPYDSPAKPAERPNLARLVFLDQHTRELYLDWKRKCRDAVAYLRRSAAVYPDDSRLNELVGELSVHSPEFATLWSAHPVRECAFNVRDYHHPLVGQLTLRDELLTLPDDEGLRLALYGVDPGSPSEAALRLLAEVVAQSGSAPTGSPGPTEPAVEPAPSNAADH